MSARSTGARRRSRISGRIGSSGRFSSVQRRCSHSGWWRFQLSIHGLGRPAGGRGRSRCGGWCAGSSARPARTLAGGLRRLALRRVRVLGPGRRRRFGLRRVLRAAPFSPRLPALLLDRGALGLGRLGRRPRGPSASRRPAGASGAASGALARRPPAPAMWRRTRGISRARTRCRRPSPAVAPTSQRSGPRRAPRGSFASRRRLRDRVDRQRRGRLVEAVRADERRRKLSICSRWPSAGAQRRRRAASKCSSHDSRDVEQAAALLAGEVGEVQRAGLRVAELRRCTIVNTGRRTIALSTSAAGVDARPPPRRGRASRSSPSCSARRSGRRRRAARRRSFPARSMSASRQLPKFCGWGRTRTPSDASVRVPARGQALAPLADERDLVAPAMNPEEQT